MGYLVEAVPNDLLGISHGSEKEGLAQMGKYRDGNGGKPEG